MSHYLSSFLVDPVVRQAHRISRSANDSPQTDLRQTSVNDEASTQANVSDSTFTTVQGMPALVDLGTNIDPIPNTSHDHHSVPLPTSVRESENSQLQEVEVPSESMEVGDTGDEANAQDLVFVATEDPVNHSIHGVSSSSGSITSSFNNSARSLIDSTMTPADPAMHITERDPQAARRSRGDSDISGVGDGILLADDGMSHTRKRIIAIQRSDSSNEAKARLIHGIMTEKHNVSQQSLTAPRPCSPDSIQSSRRAWTPSSPKSMDSLKRVVSPPSSLTSDIDHLCRFQLSPQDLCPTYYQQPQHGQELEKISNDAEEVPKALGCQHYKRNIKLQCSACYRWYTCRFCHDAVEDHMLNRRETKNMLCMLCGCAQPASGECTRCHECTAWYYCDVCKLWDDDVEKSIYHCNECGICRIGEGLGKDFFHCKVSSTTMRESDADYHADLLRLHVHIYSRHSSLY